MSFRRQRRATAGLLSLALALLVLLVAACGDVEGDDDESSETSAPTQAATTATATPAPPDEDDDGGSAPTSAEATASPAAEPSRAAGAEAATPTQAPAGASAATPGGAKPLAAGAPLPGTVIRTIERIDEALTGGSTDVSALSQPPLLKVTADGRIELVFHSDEPTGASEEADLEALGATIVTTLRPSTVPGAPQTGRIVARVPHDQVVAASALPWVEAVTLPDPGIHG